jgi:8-hydroxy-5-deazaflavin:NADPH oxidoreductase
MKYAIIGSGQIGAALARAFARKNIEVAIANTRGPETLASLAKELGLSVVPRSLQDAYHAEIIFLAVPFPAHKDVAKQFKQWNGKIVVDVTNTLDLSPQEREALGGLLSSEIVSKAFVGARLVKAFNHLPAKQLGTNPATDGQRGCCSRGDATWLCSDRTWKARSRRRASSRSGRPARRFSVSEFDQARLIDGVTP